MAKFALLDDNNIVINVIVIPDEYEKNGIEYIKSIGLDGNWINAKKEYNNKEFLAGIGYEYNKKYNIFIEPQPVPWSSFDELSLEWTVPPDINRYTGEKYSEEELLLMQVKDDIIKQVKMQRLV